jgi:hypothetical protein
MDFSPRSCQRHLSRSVARWRSVLVCSALALVIAVLAPVALGRTSVASAATGISSADASYISYLRSIFGVTSASASDAELAQILDSEKIGPEIKADISCGFHGVHAIDSTSADVAVLTLLLDQLQPVLRFAAVTSYIAGVVLVNKPAAIQILYELQATLRGFASDVSSFVDAMRVLFSDRDYRELLSQYHGFRVDDGMDTEEAVQELEFEFSPVLNGVASQRGVSVSTLEKQFEYTSNCMSLAQDYESNSGFATYITTLVAHMRQYLSQGGQAGNGLVVVPVNATTVDLINDGPGVVQAPRLLDGSDHAVGWAADLEPGATYRIGLDGVTTGSVASIAFTLDGVEGLRRTFSSVSSLLYVGKPIIFANSTDPATYNFDLTENPRVANNAPASYRWDFGDGTMATTVQSTHPYSCPGTNSVKFTASANGQTVTRSDKITINPPYTADWRTDTGSYGVAPGVPLTFVADPSIPTANTNISWDFGDGGTANGATVPHTFATAGVITVRMSVTQTNPTCPPIVAKHYVTVGRSDLWVPLSGALYQDYTMGSDVAGYVLSSVTVMPGITLKAGPGVVVKASGSTSSCYSCSNPLVVNGSLVVSGTATAPVVFTSTRDDSAGGHYGSGTSSTPAVSDWYGIQINNGATVSMDYAQIRYASAALGYTPSNATGVTTRLDHITFTSNSTGIAVSAANPITITNSTFTGDPTNPGTGISLTGNNYNPVLTGNSFTNLTTGISLTGTISPVIRNSTFASAITAIAQSGTARADARGNWWGAASGPRPTGTGARISGNVDVSPWCAASDCSQAPVFLSATPPTAATVAAPFSYAFTAAFLPAATFAVDAGNLPAGITLSADGVLSGTPSDGGSYTFTVTATNTNGTATAGPFTINVSEVPSILATPPPGTATVGSQYAYTFVTDGWPQPSVTLSQGQLPDGLTLAPDGSLSGTPTTAGQYSFNITATNSAGSASAGPLVIDVAPVDSSG